MKLVFLKIRTISVLFLVGALVAGCSSDLQQTPQTGSQVPSQDGSQGQDDGANQNAPDDRVTEVPSAGTIPSSQFELIFDTTEFTVVEGAGFAQFPITITRSEEHQSDINLFVSGVTAVDNEGLGRRYNDSVISVDEQQTQLQLSIDLGPRPIQTHERSIQVSAIDADGEIFAQVLTLRVTPTSAPDVYLLIGQSNMVGNSEDDARQSGRGGLDEPVERIKQLNVTGNDGDNFPNIASFTNPDSLVDTNNPVTLALDPLHTGLESAGTKTGTRIGLGLSFAKRALADTTAEILLVPAAWSDTGFCSRETNLLPGVGWSATPQTNVAFSGTLLHDRAIARTNLALEQTGGILRGILWHQGEADSNNSEVCASAYAQNLQDMVRSMRSNIEEDARGAVARGPDADIPFIVGTMSMGDGQLPFSPTKLLVDAAHRTVGEQINHANHVNSDDLIPRVYPCGVGSCIHFGSEALREMGVRYYEALISTLP